jgi:hypothetical protein
VLYYSYRKEKERFFDMRQATNTEKNKFLKMIEDTGVEMTPSVVLMCIEHARQMMLTGEVSVEAYYAAKNILVDRCVMTSEAIN